MSIARALLGVVALSAATAVNAYDNSRSDNAVAYYGQNSVGASGGGKETYQKSIGEYCKDDSVDVFPLSFLTVFFGTGGVPEINMANTCNGNDNKVFNGTQLPDCSFLEEDIKKCQAAGKAITLSMGGATGGNAFTDDKHAQDFADQIWNMFLGGTSDIRPFGKTPLDGIDLDIEGGSPSGYAAFVTQLRTHFKEADKKYIVTAAPQCVYPDAYLGDALNNAEFDAIYIQFYNNYCGVNNYGNANAWNFAAWEDWAEKTSKNKDVKLYIGVPASTGAANSGSYVDAATVVKIATETRSNSKHFGGVMYWDISQAVNNDNFNVAVKNGIKSGDASPPPPPPSSPVPTAPSSTEVPPPSSTETPAPSSTLTPGGGGEASTAVPTSTEDPCPPESTEPASTVIPTPIFDPSPTGDPCPPEETDATPTPTEDPCPPEETSTPTPPPANGTGAGSSGGSCDAWDANKVYTAGMCVTSGGKSYKAAWWTQNETPGGSSGVWVAGAAKREAPARPTPLSRFNPHGGATN